MEKGPPHHVLPMMFFTLQHTWQADQFLCGKRAVGDGAGIRLWLPDWPLLMAVSLRPWLESQEVTEWKLTGIADLKAVVNRATCE